MDCGDKAVENWYNKQFCVDKPVEDWDKFSLIHIASRERRIVTWICNSAASVDKKRKNDV
ncbi:hypothetical protein [Aquibacillus kalidii]|uniref:hypothetical protein n=1 Tax=Aquibacillus kalidii TaxID=2762597 RepID=UPI001C996A5C|nr:hypothetical protein [Aquibacillus kalidii]